MFFYYFKKIALLIGIVSGILTIVDVFWRSPFYNEKRIKIEHYSELMYLLSDGIDSLQVYYKGNELPNIWKSHIKIENNGLQKIHGAGSYSDILNDTLLIRFSDQYEIINYTILQNDLEASLDQTDHVIYVSFKKWNPFEKIKLTVLLSSKEGKLSPTISGNERDIIGAKIQYNNVDVGQIGDSSNDIDWLIELKSWFPIFLIKTGKYFTYFICIIFIIFPFYIIIFTIQDYCNFKKWKRNYWSLFIKELEASGIPVTDKEKYKKAPYNIPKDFQKDFTYLPDSYISFGWAVFLFLYLFILFVPMIVYVLFAWNNL